MSKWKRVLVTKAPQIEFLKGIIEGYDYSEPSKMEVTDEKFCEHVTSLVRRCKEIIFNIIQSGFEMQKQSLEKDLVKIMAELDIFSDEIKMRVFECDRVISQKWLEKLVSYDYHIIKGMEEINRDAENLLRMFVRAEAPSSKFFDEYEWRKMKKIVEDLFRRIEEMAVMFKEREAICNIRQISLEKTFEAIKNRLRTGMERA